MTSLNEAFSILALGCPVELRIPGRWEPVIVYPGEHGRACWLLNNPANGVTVALPEWASPTPEAVAGKIPPPFRRPPLWRPQSGESPVLAAPAEGWPSERVCRALTGLGYRVAHKRPGIWRSKCPYHGGRSANSLAIGERPDGSAWVKCWGQCDRRDVLAVLGLTTGDLWPPEPEGVYRLADPILYQLAGTA